MVAPKKIGVQTRWFQNPPVILGCATIVGEKEGMGPLGHTFDKIITDSHYHEKSWEKAEQRMLQEAMQMAVERTGLSLKDIDFMLAGDLLNQIISANYTARNLEVPFIGLYGACSTLYESMALGAMLIDGGYAEYVLIGACSHYATAERQYRFPVEQGTQRPLYAQWTVTGAAGMVLARQGPGPVITHATIGKVVDLGQQDPMNMGAAMAPAAADTIMYHFIDTGRTIDYYDLVITGDLGTYGKELAQRILINNGYDITSRLVDCGVLIYAPEQDAHAGGSGCACSAVVTCGYLQQEIQKGHYRHVLGVGTGALLSPCSSLQGENIPGIAHAVVIEAG
jgi:stage V sporulation protein AD